MKSLKTKLHFESFLEHPVLFFLLTALFLFFKERFFFISFLFCTLFWFLRTKNRSFLLFCSVLLIASVPLYSEKYPTMEQGTAIIVKEKYSVLANGNQKLLVYTDKPLKLDAEYRISGEFQKIEDAKGFFRFDTLSWAHGIGAYYSADGENCVLLQQHATIRHILQTKIEEMEDEDARKQFDHILLNIRSSEEDPDAFLYRHGFSYAGILLVWNRILKYFFDSKKRKTILLVMNLVLIGIYHAPFLLVQSFLFRLMKYTKLDQAQRTSICLILVLILYPCSLMSFSFLLPACYRLSFLVEKKNKKMILLLILCLQSLFLHHVNPIELLLYSLNLFVIGTLWLLGLAALWIPWIPITNLTHALNWFNVIWRPFTIYGSMFGLGTFFYLLLCMTFQKKKYHAEIFIALFFLFQCTGLFHPFAEVTTINVGQGDSILIREPFNMQNVLIDTGKPSQWNTLNDFLHAKGITKIHTLVVTHFDDDHSGNMDAIMTEYHPDQVVYSYQEKIESGALVFYDLNHIQNSNDNESSLVLAADLNHLTYLFMGDADQTAEEQIARTYGNLHCDILKLSHHGSATGSCSAFLDTVRPEIGLISSGAYNIYHHPSPKTLQQLLKRHIEYFDTKDSGDISIIAITGFNFLITAEGKLGIIG